MTKGYIKFAWTSIRHRGMRSWLTIIGIVIGVASIISLITVGQGMQNAVGEQFEKLGIRNIRIVPANLQGPPSSSFTLPNSMIEKVEAISVVEYVDKVMMESGIIEFNNEEKTANVLGYDVSLADRGFADLDVKAEEGRLFLPGDKGVVLIGNDIAKETFDKDASAKNSITLEGKKFRVIGVIEKTGTAFDRNVYIPLDDARDLFDRHNDINAMAVHVKEGIGIDEAKAVIEAELLKSYDDEDFDILTPQQILGQINRILGVVKAVFAGIAAISLIVGAVGIMNSMFTSVLERTRDIGVMKAVGARNSDIAAIFLAEAGIMGAVGGIFGIIIGTAFAFGAGLIAQEMGFPLLSIGIDYAMALAALIFSFVIGAIAGLVPALQAAKLKPVDALRYE